MALMMSAEMESRFRGRNNYYILMKDYEDFGITLRMM